MKSRRGTIALIRTAVCLILTGAFLAILSYGTYRAYQVEHEKVLQAKQERDKVLKECFKNAPIMVGRMGEKKVLFKECGDHIKVIGPTTLPAKKPPKTNAKR